MPPPAPPPPPPPGPGPGGPPLAGSPATFKKVPLLGDALHEMKKKLTGFEETPAASEGVASEKYNRQVAVKEKIRSKSHYGSQVPGKPKRNNDFLSEIQTKLNKRRDKVDAESYVVETPDHLVVVETLPPSGQVRNGDTVDYRRMSKDSGRCSLTPSLDGDGQRRYSVDYSQYQRVSVDHDRKEELILAKEVRKSSVKMMRASPSPSSDFSDSGTLKDSSQSPETIPSNLPPPSPAVLRYWKQCAGAIDDDENPDEGRDENDEGQSSEPSWKTDAIEGDIQEFPSIKDKMKFHEEVGKKEIGRFSVPDVKSKMRQGEPGAGWMEARTKLQSQLDTLIAKTTAKITKYGTVHAIERKEITREETPEEQNREEEESTEKHKKVISPAISNIIKSVASEIQKSFSSKHLVASENGDDEDNCDENNNGEYCKNQNEPKTYKQPKIDMEAPIDFDYNEPEVDQRLLEGEEEEEEENIEEATNSTNCSQIERENVPEQKMEEETEENDSYKLEGPVGFERMPGVLDASAARSKASLMRKTSTERRLPASVMAKRRAASMQMTMIQKIEKELIDASCQVNILNTEEELENMNDEEKVDLIAKQISKMESGYIMKLLKQLESGILDISVPMLLPFLSLQVRLDMGSNIFKELDPDNKAKVVKENFIQDMLNDITDIALLQEVIDRTQDKINFLNTPKPIPNDYFSLEDDSFELNLPTPRYYSPAKEVPVPVLTDVLCHLDKLMKEGNVKAKSEKKVEEKKIEAKVNKVEEKKDDHKEASKKTVAKVESKVVLEQSSVTIEAVKSDSDDEGLPSSVSVSDSSSDEEKEKVEDSVKVQATEDKCKADILEARKSPTPEPKIVSKSKKEEETKSSMEEAPKKSTENEIKTKLRNILDNCKTNEKQRPVRNFGRNFEFQGIQLKPVVPNDKRPPKARRMDDMWMSTIASKQKWPCNNEISVPKPKVPWTMNKNTQPQKKDENKEVKEFENCHKNLKSTESKQNATVKENQNSSKEAVNTDKKEDDIIIEESVHKKDIIVEEAVEKKNIEVKKDSNQEDKINSKSTDKQNDLEEDKLINTDTFKENEIELEEKSKTTNESKVSTGSRQPKIDMEDPIDFDYTEPEVSKVVPIEPVDSKPPAPKTIRKETSETPKADEEPKTSSTSDTKYSEAVSKDVPSTPIVRRRGDTFTVVIPLPRDKPPPPPPMVRPPPPPMSPPVTAATIVQMEKENKVVGKVEKVESESEYSEEEEESEWEWTEEEESEDEGATYEVHKEGWENIMSDAKGPTTFNADYSIKVGGK